MTLKVETVILPGNRIEIRAPGLPEGQPATVLILVHDAPPPPKRRLSDVLGDYRGGQFHSAAEVDDYLRVERESWGG